MKIKLIALAITMFATAISASSIEAAFLQYDNRAVFEAAAGATTTETYNSYGSDVNLIGAIEDVGLFKMDGTSLTGLSLIESNGSDSLNVDGTAFWRGIGSSGSMQFVFDTGITAFGVDLYGINNDTERTRISILADTFFLPVVNGSQFSFFGVTSDTAFSTVSFNLLTGEDAGIDNVTFAAVPEPSTFILLGGGLAGLAFAVRRKKKE